ncbi:MAG TPA: hypothetical protein VGD67_24055 [Pseudonocardiaceae bacterium]
MSYAEPTGGARLRAALPWPAGWARRTRGPQYRPAVISGVVCVLVALTLALNNMADGLLLLVFAAGVFVYALRPADAHPVRVRLAEARPTRLRAGTGTQFPLRRTASDWLGRRPTITLTPTAVVADQGGPVVVPWSRITEIRAGEAATGVPYSLLPPPRRNWITIGVTDPATIPGATPARRSRLQPRFGPTTVVGLPTTTLLSDPVVLFHALHFYLDNPQARVELATPSGPARIRHYRVNPSDA